MGKSTFIQTEQNELKVRSNDRTINTALIEAPVGSTVAGLLDDFGHVVSLTVNGETVATYGEFAHTDRTQRRWFAFGVALFATWCLVDAGRAWQTGG
ncbi:MAG: hypothetical protein WBC44_05065 [Planctomycetaceae bacterium]